MDFFAESLVLHSRYQGKIALDCLVNLNSKADLALAYTPGVAQPCRAIAANKNDVYRYTLKGRTVAVVTDGSAVLGLGNIGPEAALPVMEGKCALFKRFGGIDAFPICLNTQDTATIIKTVEMIAPVFGGINLEDISAPRCFEIERELKKKLDIPVFHDDQHGTAIVVLAGLINALKLAQKSFSNCRCVVAGAGAAGLAVSDLLKKYGMGEILVVDRSGIIDKERNDLNFAKREILKITNSENRRGGLKEAMVDADVFVGVAAPGILLPEMIETMAAKAVVFALSNPEPEIAPDLAKKAGAYIVASGRSDHPNQINNVLAFPAVFKAALTKRNINLDQAFFMRAAEALAEAASPFNPEKIIPDVFEPDLAEKISAALLLEERKTNE